MAPHTTTGEWQSFELRMRRRRAARLALRADAAVDAGCVDAAREALAEARHLEPRMPDLDRIEQRLTCAVDLPPALDDARAREGGSHEASGRWKIAVAVILGVVAIGGAAYISVDQVNRLEPTRQFHEASSAIEAPPPAPPVAPVSEGAEPASLREDTPIPATPAAPAPVERPDVRPVFEPPDPPAARPLPGAPDASLPSAPPPTIPEATRAVSGSPSVMAMPSPPAAPPAPIVPQAAVRTTLDRYAAAYSDLDADAARRVWPGVNRDALARAFDSLASQRVSLGACSIDVTGASARARCAGSTTWQPKVGSGEARTDARTWTFELAKSGADWTIVNARVQNR